MSIGVLRPIFEDGPDDARFAESPPEQSAKKPIVRNDVMRNSAGRQLSLREAVRIFETMPAEWQLASLHPKMVELDAKRDALLEPVYWCFQTDDKCLIHSFQLGENPGLGIRDIQSAYGYGGPLSNSSAPDFLEAADQSFEQWAKENSVIVEFLRFHPMIPYGCWYSGEAIDNRQTVHIDLTKGLFEQYETRRRTDVRRFLETGSRVVRVSPQVMEGIFPDIYAENMNQIEAAGDYYFGKGYFDALFSFSGAENWLVYSENKAIAGAVILISPQARIAEYHLSGKATGYDRQRATIGLLHSAAHYYQSLRYRSFYLGGGRGVDENDSLLFFKKGFSSLTAQYRIGSRVFEPEKYAQLKRMLPDKAAMGRVLFYKDR